MSVCGCQSQRTAPARFCGSVLTKIAKHAQACSPARKAIHLCSLAIFFFVPIDVFVAAMSLRKCTHHLHSARRIILLLGGWGTRVGADAGARCGRTSQAAWLAGRGAVGVWAGHCTYGAAAVLSCLTCRGAILYCVLSSQQVSVVELAVIVFQPVWELRTSLHVMRRTESKQHVSSTSLGR